MESQMASWQLEKLSTAAPIEFNSPPNSPSPSSPTLYSNEYVKSENLPSPLPVPLSRAELATKILKALEENKPFDFAHFENEDTLNWSEESVELFEDLNELNYDDIRPHTPDSPEFKNQQDFSELDESYIPQHQPTSPANSTSSDTYEELNAVFENILAGLSAQVTSVEEGPIIEIDPLETTIALQNLQFELNNSQDNEEAQLEVAVSSKTTETDTLRVPEDDSSCSSSASVQDGEMLLPAVADADNCLIENEMEIEDMSHTFSEVELALIGLNNDAELISSCHEGQSSSSESAQSSPSSSLISEVEELEHQMDTDADSACEGILDALLQGDLVTAQSFIPIVNKISSFSVQSNPDDASQSSSLPDSNLDHVESSLKSRTSKTGLKKPRLPRGTDKIQRKKDQNKTAATRYREKKKFEAAMVSVQEDDLAKTNAQLKEQYDDLRRQVLIYKELLREVMSNRKKKTINVKSQSLPTIIRGSKTSVRRRI